MTQPAADAAISAGDAAAAPRGLGEGADFIPRDGKGIAVIFAGAIVKGFVGGTIEAAPREGGGLLFAAGGAAASAAAD